MKSISFPVFIVLAVADARAETPVVLDPVEVTAPTPSLTVPSIDAARADLARTPGGTEIVDAERYLSGRASTVADTFFLSPGVIAQSRFGADEARLSIRGSGLQRTFHGRGIRVMQDGVPLNLADGGFDMQALEPTATAYVNVWRGGNALAHGAASLGGAIDYVSRTGRDAAGAFARVEGGSWDYLRTTVAGGDAWPDMDGYASFTHQQQNGFRDHAEQSNQRLFTNAGWRASELIETRLYVTAVKTDSELPGNLTKAQLEDDPRQANPGNVALDQKRDFELARVATKTAFHPTPDTRWTLVAAWTYKDLDHPIFQVIDQRANDGLVGLSLEQKGVVLGRTHLLRGGMTLQRGETDAANFLNMAGERGGPVSRDEQAATNAEAFLESQLALGGGFTGVLGANAARHRRDTTRTFGAVTPANTYERDYERVSPKAGARWDNAARDAQVYANVSGSYEPPSFSESGTPTVANDAQTATTFEVGTRGARHWLKWDASVYRSAVKNEFLAVQLPPPAAPGASGTINAARTVHEGVEAGFEADVLAQDWKTPDLDRLVLRAAWTWGRFRFDDDAIYGDNTLAGLPEHLIRGEFLWETASGWYAGPTFEWSPMKTYVDHRNTFAADPYALLGLKVGRRREVGVSWFIEMRNVTDERYAATTGVVERFDPLAPAQLLPGDGRSVYAGIEYRF